MVFDQTPIQPPASPADPLGIAAAFHGAGLLLKIFLVAGAAAAIMWAVAMGALAYALWWRALREREEVYRLQREEQEATGPGPVLG